MNQYIVYALTRQAGMLYDLIPTTAAERQAEHQRWSELRNRLDALPTTAAVHIALESREMVEPEPDLSPAARTLNRRIERKA